MRSNLESVSSNAIAPVKGIPLSLSSGSLLSSSSPLNQSTHGSSSITCFCQRSACHHQHPTLVNQDFSDVSAESLLDPSPSFASGAVTVPELISPTGFDAVDGLLDSRKWANSTITFSFPDNFELDYVADYPRYASHAASFALAPEGLQTVVRHWLSEIALVANLTFIEFDGLEDSATEDEEALMRIAMSNDPGSAYAYSPWESDESADVWFNNDTYGAWFDQAKMGEYAWHTIGHELSHALGLKHGHEGGGVSGVALPLEQDSMEFSIMTYRSYENQVVTGAYANAYGNYAQTLMMLDIQAFQRLYGANYTAYEGDTTYSFSPTTGELFIDGNSQGQPVLNTIFRTIWDGNGTDTYDFADYVTSLRIDLNPGGYVDLDRQGNLQRALLGQEAQVYARGHVFNSLLVDDDPRSLIENAVGGTGNDYIEGNVTANRLDGGEGNDRIKGRGGTDTLVDGPGKDILSGGGGADYFLLAADGRRDRITDFTVGIDQLDLSSWGITDSSQLQLEVKASSLDLVFDRERLTLNNVDAALFDLTAIVGVPVADTNSPSDDANAEPDPTVGNETVVPSGDVDPSDDTIDAGDTTGQSTDVGGVSSDDQPAPDPDTSDTDLSDSDNLVIDLPINPTGSIQGQVRRDNDADGNLTDADPGLGGVTLNLFLDSNKDGVADAGAIATTQANSYGFYTFSNLPYNQYIVTEINRPRYRSTADVDGSNPDQIVATVNSPALTQQDFLDARVFAAQPVKRTGTTKSDQLKGTDAAEEFYGRGGDDFISGEGGNDDMWGSGGDDHLSGGAGDDKLRGEEGNDKLHGNNGDDLIKGSSARFRGAYERDVYRGGPGKDEFVIGTSKHPYYVADGQNDYALLADFNPVKDTVLLHGAANLYKVSKEGSSTLLWFQSPEGGPSELVASFAQISSLRLRSDSFRYF